MVSARGYPLTTGSVFRITGESGDGDLDVEQAGTNVQNPGSETHEPEIDDEVTVIWYGPENSQILAEYTIESGVD